MLSKIKPQLRYVTYPIRHFRNRTTQTIFFFCTSNICYDKTEIHCRLQFFLTNCWCTSSLNLSKNFTHFAFVFFFAKIINKVCRSLLNNRNQQKLDVVMHRRASTELVGPYDVFIEMSKLIS